MENSIKQNCKQIFLIAIKLLDFFKSMKLMIFFTINNKIYKTSI